MKRMRIQNLCIASVVTILVLVPLISSDSSFACPPSVVSGGGCNGDGGGTGVTSNQNPPPRFIASTSGGGGSGSGNTVLPAPSIYFTNVHVDTNPVPNKPFTIYADIQSVNVNTGNLIVYIAPSPGISVTSPLFATTTFTSQGNTVRATWTLLTGNPGSYPIQLIAKSNFPPDLETFDLTVNVGSPHSLFVSGLDIPGNIFPNDNFTVGLKLRNALNNPDSNINAQIIVPAGLQLLDDVSKHISSVGAGQEVDMTWKLQAQTPGSYSIGINYSSINSGLASTSAGVSVGTKPSVSGGLISITTQASNIQPYSQNPVVFNIVNNGVQDVHNLQIVDATGNGYTSMNTPAWVGDLPIGAKKSVTLQISTTNGTLLSQIPVSVRYDSNGNNYQEKYQTGIELSNLPDFKISSISSEPPVTYAGDTAAKIMVNIFNAGPGASDVYANLSLPPQFSPAWGNATSVYFGRIGTFETVPATFYVNIKNDAVSGAYPMTLVVTNGKQRTTLNTNFVISQKAAFTVISVDDAQLYPGASNVPLKVTLKNTGTAASQTLSSTLLSGNAVPGVRSTALTTVGNVENIGTVLPDQVFTTTFLVSLDPVVAPGDQLSTVELNWTQNGTNTFTQSIQVPYHVANGPSYLLYAGGIPLTYVALAILAIIGLVLFAIKRRERLQAIEMASIQHRADTMTPLEFPTVEPLEDISASKVNEYHEEEFIRGAENDRGGAPVKKRNMK